MVFVFIERSVSEMHTGLGCKLALKEAIISPGDAN